MRIDTLEMIDKEDLIGKVIAFPTDTVYGVGALIDDVVAIEKIYALKHRELQKPLAILAGSIQDILPYIETPSSKALEMMHQYWPGALTIIFRKSKLASDKLTRGLNTIAFRIPNEQQIITFLKKVGPVATTSVNISGDMPLNDPVLIDTAFGEKIDYIYYKNVSSSNVSSTVIDCSSDEIKVLRVGEIKIEP